MAGAVDLWENRSGLARDEAGWQISFEDGGMMRADHVVLAGAQPCSFDERRPQKDRELDMIRSCPFKSPQVG